MTAADPQSAPFARPTRGGTTFAQRWSWRSVVDNLIPRKLDMRCECSWLSCVIALVCAIAGRATCAAEDEFFEKEVRPLLVERCYKCHSGDEREGGLRLDSRFLVLKGGESGPAVVPDKPETSLLLKAIEYLDEPKMPPDGKLADNELEVLRKWVTLGAPWPATDDAGANSTQPVDANWAPTDKQRDWWAFQPVQEPALPAVQDSAWPQTDIDRFLWMSGRTVPRAPANRRPAPRNLRSHRPPSDTCRAAARYR
jgi:hypothetical protein